MSSGRCRRCRCGHGRGCGCGRGCGRGRYYGRSVIWVDV